MSHYTVGYHDNLNHHHEICEYADDAYNAIRQAREDLPELKDHSNAAEYCIKEDQMNGRLDKVAMTNRLMQLKRDLHYKCEIGEKKEGYCRGANEYLNRTFDVLDEYWS